MRLALCLLLKNSLDADHERIFRALPTNFAKEIWLPWLSSVGFGLFVCPSTHMVHYGVMQSVRIPKIFIILD